MPKKMIITCDGCGVEIEEPSPRRDPDSGTENPLPLVIYASYGEANHDPRNSGPINEWDSKVFHSFDCFKNYDFTAWQKEIQKAEAEIEESKAK